MQAGPRCGSAVGPHTPCPAAATPSDRASPPHTSPRDAQHHARVPSSVCASGRGLELLHQRKSLKGGRSNRSRLSAPPSWSMSKGKFLITDTSNVNQLPGDPLLLLPQGSLLWAVPLAVSWGAAIFPLRTLSITHLSAFFFFFLISIFLTSSYYSQIPSYRRLSKSVLEFWQLDNSLFVPLGVVWGHYPTACPPQPAALPAGLRSSPAATQVLVYCCLVKVILQQG